MIEHFDIHPRSAEIAAAPRLEYFELAPNSALIGYTGNLIEVPRAEIQIIETARSDTLAVETRQVEILEKCVQGPQGAKGLPADTEIIQAGLAANETKIVDRLPIIGFWAAQWLVTAEDDTGARRSLIVDATLNTADVDFVRYAGRGEPVAFIARPLIDGSDVALQIENRSASPLSTRIIRLETRF